MFATSICKHTRTKEGEPSSREASANYVGPCGQKFQVTYLRSCARFHGLGAVQARKRNRPRIRVAKMGIDGRKRERERERYGQRQERRLRSITISRRRRKMSGEKKPSKAHDDWNDRLQIYLKTRSKSLPTVFSFLLNYCLNARACILDTNIRARTNDMIIIHFLC